MRRERQKRQILDERVDKEWSGFSKHCMSVERGEWKRRGWQRSRREGQKKCLYHCCRGGGHGLREEAARDAKGSKA